MVWRGLEGVAAGLAVGALTEDAFMVIGATEGGLRIGREDGGEGGRPTDGSVWGWEAVWSFGGGCRTSEYIYIAENPW